MTQRNIDPAALDQHGLPTPLTLGQNGNPPDSDTQEADIEEITYEPVPPRSTVSVSVRYRIRSRGRPLPYPLEEEREENVTH